MENNKGKIFKKGSKQSGITLVALVVTVVVLLILTSIGIKLALGNNGIIGEARNAKELSEIDDEKSVISRAVLRTMISNKNNEISEDDLRRNLEDESSMKVNVTENDKCFIIEIPSSKRRYFVDENGSVRKAEWWKEKDETGNNVITNGEIKLKVGDYVNYDPMNTTNPLTYVSTQEKNGVKEQTISADAETGGWRIFDICYTSEGENIVLISTSGVQTTDGEGFSLNGFVGYSNGEDELNNACEIFGHGKGAVKAKSISMTDINRITRYNPMKTGDNKIYGQGEIGEYKNEITIKKESDYRWTGTSTNGSTWETTYSFSRMDKNGEWTKMLATGEIFKYENTYYYYNPVTLTENSEEEEKGISTTSQEYKMLFGYSNPYFIATKYISTGGFVTYGIFHRTEYTNFFNFGKTDDELTGSGQPVNWHTITTKIRPLVYLSNSITFKKSDETVNGIDKWNINI